MTKKELGQALKLGLAAWLAFALATAFGVQHAFWASMPVWVVARPWRGVVLERAMWRLLGTLAGGALGLLLLLISPSPWVTALIMALIISAGTGCIHLWQGVRSYLPLMVGITVAVIVIPAMMNPTAGMELALDRLYCTVIGASCVAVIVGLFTPKADRESFRDEVLHLADDFETATRHALSGQDDAEVSRVIHQAAAIEDHARLMAAGSPDGYQQMAAVDAIIAAGLAMLATAETLRLEGNFETVAAQRYMEAPAETTPPAHGGYSRLIRARRALEAGRDRLTGQTTTTVEPSGFRLPSPRNPGRSRNVAIMAFLGSMAGSVAIILTDSAAAELTAFSVAIFAMVLGSMPLPHVLAPKLAVGVVLGVIAGMIYRIGVQPHVTDWASLVLTIAPFIIVGALARGHHRTAVYALDANMCFMLASQAGEAPIAPGQALFIGFCMAGGTLVMVACYMLMPRPSRDLVKRAAERQWRDIELLARRSRPMSFEEWMAISGRRIITLASELEKAGELMPREILSISAFGHVICDQRREAAEHDQLEACDRSLTEVLENGPAVLDRESETMRLTPRSPHAIFLHAMRSAVEARQRLTA